MLQIFVGLIPTATTPTTSACTEYLELLLDLTKLDPNVAQRFLPNILAFVVSKLRMMTHETKGDTICNLFRVANELYGLLDPSIFADDNLALDEIQQHIAFLLDQCLFGDLHNQSILCPSGSQQRNQAFDLLFKIISTFDTQPKIQTDLIRQLLASLANHLHITSPQISYDTPGYEDRDEPRNTRSNKSGHALHRHNRRKDFVGLVNLGCTCYLNSIIQQLFMVPSFTNELLSIPAYHTASSSTSSSSSPSPSSSTPNTSTPGDGINHELLSELQRVLLALRESQRRYLNPLAFASKVHNAEGAPIDLWEQTDCQESLVALFHQLEDNLKQSALITQHESTQTLLDDHFGCTLRYLVKCENGHVTKRDEKHMSLQLPVKHTYNLSEAFDKFTEAMKLDGDNKYQCSSCRRKVPAVRRCTMYKPPKQLILCLKRFEWNFETSERKKLNTRFEFDSVLNVKQYLNTNFPEEESDDGAESKSSDEDNSELVYDLVGIVIHQGSANRGHYYAYIKDRTGSGSHSQWYEFNDKNVSPRDFASIQKEAFGGETTVTVDDRHDDDDDDVSSQKSSGSRSRSKNNPWNKQTMTQPKPQNVEILSDRNAYILFYEQRAVKQEQQLQRRRHQQQRSKHQTAYESKESSNEIDLQQPWKHVTYLKEEYTRIRQENINIFRQQTLYDKAFVRFMRNLYNNVLLAEHSHFAKMQDQNRNLVLLRFVFNVVPVELTDSAQIRWWWDTLRDAVDKFAEHELKALATSKLLPSYLINIFGKHQNGANRKAALQFFKHLLLKIGERNAAELLLNAVFCALVTVVHEWRPRLLAHADMSEIIDLLNYISARSEKCLVGNAQSLMAALRELLLNDFAFAHNLNSADVPESILRDLGSSDSNLATEPIFNLIWHIMANDKIDEEALRGNNEIEFLRQVMCKNYCVSQVQIVKRIVAENTNESDLKLFNQVIEVIHRRMAWLDYYDVFAALNVFNALFEGDDDDVKLAKLNTNCCRVHLQKILSNSKYWKLTQVSVLMLAKLCENMMVRGWITQSCPAELHDVDSWCKKNNKAPTGRNRQSNRNRNYRSSQANVQFYRVQPEFNEKDAKQRLNEWRNRVSSKVKLADAGISNESLPAAMKTISS
mmetsp:Transcript_51794/g.82622  ORF Transcript_51794/g.82622 Transcript_51794/m.82622 type:complete len:1123 (-) Transcript_51794:111-3479(-)